MEVSVASLAVAWITPPPLELFERNESGRPSSSTIQSRTWVSSSVAAGLVIQLIPFTPSPAASSSPRIDGYEEFAGKKAKKRRVLPVGEPGQDLGLEVAEHVLERLGLGRGVSRQPGAEVARLHAGWTRRPSMPSR